ncbi:Global transcription regulator sge1 [Frankliniella fusca]|uniref:Global transcription regulator sge1 n=1 Tax=Frankliniella fusca TaxID=407009 RepID=A0AAE1HSB1_9NEOP|nr:Global transcription regulator sge1 [Frankliniella fusca]
MTTALRSRSSSGSVASCALGLLAWCAVATQAQLTSSSSPTQPQLQQPQLQQPQMPQPQLQQPQMPQPQLQQPQMQQPQPQLQLIPQLQPQLATPYSPQNSVLLQCRQTVPSTDQDIMELQREVLPVSQAGQMQPSYPLQPQGAAALMATLFPSRAFDPVFQNSLMLTVNQCLSQPATLSQLAAAPALGLSQGLSLFNSAARGLAQLNPVNYVNYVPLAGR